jgi:transcription elongation factor S-II
MTSVLILTHKAEVKSAKLNLENGVTLKDIQKYFKKKTEPEVLGTYLYKTLTLFLFGFTTGKAGTENKHELPPPHDATLAFGDIMLIASKDENSFATPVLFKPEDYEVFYSKAFGGFDDLDDEEDEEDEIDEEELVEDVDIDIDVVDDAEEEFDKQSYVSEEEVEIVVKKEKKKKQPITITQVSIHPDKQLNESSEKNKLRNDVLSSLEKLFVKDFTRDETITLEQEIYVRSLTDADDKHIIKDWSIKLFEQVYLSNLRKITSNLYSESYVKNTELIQKYKNKEITFKDISEMNHYSLFESKWKERIEHQKNIEKRQLEGNKSMATDQFLCTRCFKRECTYYEMQTRSADEPMTIFINCLNCGKNWRQ